MLETDLAKLGAASNNSKTNEKQVIAKIKIAEHIENAEDWNGANTTESRITACYNALKMPIWEAFSEIDRDLHHWVCRKILQINHHSVDTN